MNLKPIRKLPQLKENQEWACEGGCDIIRPKKFESIFSESHSHDGSSINIQSEFYYTCQNNHLLRVWNNINGDYVSLSDDFYQEINPKIIESKSIEQSIDLLSNEIESIKESLIEESFLTNEESEYLELLITRAMQLGELFAQRDINAKELEKNHEH